MQSRRAFVAMAVIIPLLLSITPCVGYAAKVRGWGQRDYLSWDFRDLNGLDGWRISGADTARQTKNGLITSAKGSVKLLTPEGVSIPAGTYSLLEIRVKASPVYGSMVVAWAREGEKSTSENEIKIILKDTGALETVRVDLGNHPNWNGRVNSIFFGFYSDDGLLKIEGITIWRWSLLKKIEFAWDEFTRPEYFRPLSTNAIIGPDLMGMKWISWNYIFIFLFMVWLIGLSIIQKRFHERSGARKILAFIFLLWVVFDVRFSRDMALSLDNVRHWAVGPEENKRPLYLMGDFFDFAEFCMKRLPAGSHVNFLSPDRVFLPRLNYAVYPSKAEYEGTSGDIFVVYNRPDVKVSGKRLIRMTGQGTEVLSERGTKKAAFGIDSFIYERESEGTFFQKGPAQKKTFSDIEVPMNWLTSKHQP